MTTTPGQTGRTERPAQPVLRLLFSPGLAQGLRYELPSGTTALGRAPGPGLSLPADPRASRVHARVQVCATSGTARVFDCGSRNGTLVNRVRLSGPDGCALQDGDILRIGDSFLLLRYEAQKKPDGEVPELLGVSPAMAAVRHRLARVAPEQAVVLVLGETGTGKEVVATALHRLSGRSGERIAVNCSAVPEQLAESQFFGHVAGAFTGAKAHLGWFRAAHQGTLFLDEVGDIPQALQAKLLRALDERTILPIGATHPVPCDVRIVAATNRDLRQAMAAGHFREDLYARLCDVVLSLPPLRERREDILLLLEHAGGGPVAQLPPDVVELLLLHPWPGNVREVFKIAGHLRLFGADADLRARLASPGEVPVQAPAQATPAAAQPATVLQAGPRRLVRPSREELERLMRKHAGVILEVARELQCSRRQVGRWLEEHRIDRQGFRS